MSTSTSTLSLFDEIVNDVARLGLEPHRCGIVLSVAAVYTLPMAQLGRLGKTFGIVTWRHAHGVAYVIRANLL